MRTTICACIKDCGKAYLNFWIKYHLSLGFDHICIYDNDSTIPIDANYINAKDNVTVIRFPGKVPVPKVYNDFLKYTGHMYDWIAFIDDDEYIYLEQDVTIQDFLSKFDDNVSAVELNWWNFGSSGKLIAPEDGDVFNYFTKCTKSEDPFNQAIKSIVRPEKTKKMINPHFGEYVSYEVNENGKVISGPGCFPPSHKRAWVNHYHTKSREDYIKKIQRGNVDRIETTYTIDRIKAIDDVCTEDFKYQNIKKLFGGRDDTK